MAPSVNTTIDLKSASDRHSSTVEAEISHLAAELSAAISKVLEGVTQAGAGPVAVGKALGGGVDKGLGQPGAGGGTGGETPSAPCTGCLGRIRSGGW